MEKDTKEQEKQHKKLHIYLVISLVLRTFEP
jgi:hypothetical protein